MTKTEQLCDTRACLRFGREFKNRSEKFNFVREKLDFEHF
jgi:hypothetical protein